jgi:hypothetical protein
VVSADFGSEVPFLPPEIDILSMQFDDSKNYVQATSMWGLAIKLDQ